MKKLKLFETKKLHYGQYLYKLSLSNELSYIFRTDLQKKSKLSYAKVILDQLNLQYRNNETLTRQKYNSIKEVNEIDYLDAKDIFSILRKHTGYKLRCESGTLSIYSNDQDLLYKIINKIRLQSVELWEPDHKTVDILRSKEKIKIVDYQPFLQYQVHLNYKKIDTSFANWLIANQDKSRVGPRALDSIRTGSAGNFYFYIRDDKVLSLVNLLIGHNIRAVDKLIYKGDIDKYKYDS